jgi:hypothetical protein
MSASENLALLSLNFLAMQSRSLADQDNESKQGRDLARGRSWNPWGKPSTSADDSMMIETQFIHQNIRTLSNPLLYHTMQLI